jgi:hypothetical protein
MELARALLLVGPLDAQLAVFGDDRQHRRDLTLELALGAFDLDVMALDGDIDAGRDGDRKLADS